MPLKRSRIVWPCKRIRPGHDSPNAPLHARDLDYLSRKGSNKRHMENDHKLATYDVGYGKPPKHTRFTKGRSGNHHGRPKGTLNLATVLDRTLREKVVVNENGRRKVVTKLQAAIARLVDKATSGDGQAVRYLCQLVISAEERSVAEPATQLSDTDQKVLGNILQRFQQTSKEGKDEPDPE